MRGEPDGTERRHLWIDGVVQGVFFRESMRREAERLGVRGWVRNLPDGRVEAVIEGTTDAMAALLQWCRHGPSGATVEAIEEKSEAPANEAGFRVLR